MLFCQKLHFSRFFKNRKQMQRLKRKMQNQNNFDTHPLATGREKPCWQWCSYISQWQSRWQSFVPPRLVAKVVLCLGHMKTKPNQIQAAQSGRRKTELRSTMPPRADEERCPQTYPTAWAGHRHTKPSLPLCSTAWEEEDADLWITMLPTNLPSRT